MAVRILVVSLLALGALAGAAAWLGAARWDAATRALRVRLEAARVPTAPREFSARELDGLPAPVQRYLRLAIPEGRPLVSAVSLEHTGTFAMDAAGARWLPFTSSQRVVLRRPGFVWDARIALAPGVSVRVHDAYVAGEGILRAAVLGLVPVMEVRGTDEVAEGELMRFLAEAAWYPTALLPSQGVRWTAVDDSSATARLEDGGHSLELLFRFGDDGLVHTVRAAARGRTVDGRVVPTPWEGRFWDHQAVDGLLVPLSGEVAWLLPEGARPYWRGRITSLRHEPAR